MKPAQPRHHVHHRVAPQDLDEYAECDVIIVGAGSAGALWKAQLFRCSTCLHMLIVQCQKVEYRPQPRLSIWACTLKPWYALPAHTGQLLSQ